MVITVAVKVENLALPGNLIGTQQEQAGLVLVPNVEHYGTIKATIKAFIEHNLFVPGDLQVLTAPLFTKLSEKDSVESIYKRYVCHPEAEDTDIHLDEDNFVFFGREGGRTVDVDESRRLEEYHIVDKSVLKLRRLPQPLPEQGGRIFVETKHGILPLLGILPATPVSVIKQSLERMTGIPVHQQMLFSVGRDMHDDFCIRDFEGSHKICEDSTLDLCKSGDSNCDQAHKRMVISVNVMGEQCFTLVMQGRDPVQSVLQRVQSRTGIATWQQRITFSGKVLQEKKLLGDYFIHPDCTLQVTVFRSPHKPPYKSADSYSRENSEEKKPAARKIKLMRTSKGHSKGTITIPVLTTDTISDLKRKVRRTLQPLTERNFVLVHSPAKDPGATPRSNTKKDIPSPSKSPELPPESSKVSRALSFTRTTFSGPLLSQTNIQPETPPIRVANLYPLPVSPHSPAETGSMRARSVPLTEPSTLPSKKLFPPPLSPTLSPTSFPSESAKSMEGQGTDIVVEGLSNLKFGKDVRRKGGSIPMPPHGSSHCRTASMNSVPSTESMGMHNRCQSADTSDSRSTSDTFTGAGQRGLQQSRPPKSGNVREVGATEKRGISSWLTVSIHTLKEHIRAPFVER